MELLQCINMHLYIGNNDSSPESDFNTQRYVAIIMLYIIIIYIII
jgi:hypothetical protein